MTLPDPISAGVKQHLKSIQPRQALTSWVIANNDAVEIASGAELLDPELYAPAPMTVVTLITQGATSFMVRAYADKDATLITQQPQFRAYGCERTSARRRWMRLDNVDANAASTALTVNLANGMTSGQKVLGEMTAAFDALGCYAIAILVTQTLVQTGAGLITPKLQVKFLN